MSCNASLRPRAAPGALRPTLDRLLNQINATGYGLTQGVHTRIDETIARVGRPCPCRQRVREPQHGGRRGGRAAVWWRRPVGHGPEGRGPLYLLLCLLSQRPADAMARTFADATAPRRPRLRPATANCPPCRPCSRWYKARAIRHWPAPASALPAEWGKRHLPHPARPHGEPTSTPWPRVPRCALLARLSATCW